MLTSVQAYNQVQMRFRDSVDATSFISELAKFCPCKEDATNGRSTVPATSMRPPAAPLARPTPALTRMPSRTSIAPAASTFTSPTTYVAPASHLSSQSASFPTASRSVASGSRQTTTNSQSVLDTSSALDVDMDLNGSNRHHFEQYQSFVMPHSQTDVSSSPIAASTPPQHAVPSGRATPALMLTSPLVPPDSRPEAPQKDASETKEDVLSVLREVPQLYQLSTPDLEQAVGQIVREPGFLEFVRLTVR